MNRLPHISKYGKITFTHKKEPIRTQYNTAGAILDMYKEVNNLEMYFRLSEALLLLLILLSLLLLFLLLIIINY